MPKPRRRDKKLRPASPTPWGGSHRADSVKELLDRSSPLLASIRSQQSHQDARRAWLAARLPATLQKHITGLVERNGELVIFTASASWGVRVRYALAESEKPPGIDTILVRVLPKGAVV